MLFSQLPVKDVFLLRYPREMLEDVLRAIVATYPATLEEMQAKFPEGEGIDLRPHYQRALVDRDLRAVVEKYSGRGITHATRLNDNGGARHLEVYADTCVLTAHYIPVKEGTVRRAAHRIKLCDPAQVDLFRDALISVDTKLYAHILHGCHGIKAYERVTKKAPDFAYVRFPLPDMSAYAPALIDLISMFPHVLGREQSVPAHQIPDLATPVFPHKPAVGSEG